MLFHRYKYVLHRGSLKVLCTGCKNLTELCSSAKPEALETSIEGFMNLPERISKFFVDMESWTNNVPIDRDVK